MPTDVVSRSAAAGCRTSKAVEEVPRHVERGRVVWKFRHSEGSSPGRRPAAGDGDRAR
jgi:hypothetical protein